MTFSTSTPRSGNVNSLFAYYPEQERVNPRYSSPGNPLFYGQPHTSPSLPTPSFSAAPYQLNTGLFSDHAFLFRSFSHFLPTHSSRSLSAFLQREKSREVFEVTNVETTVNVNLETFLEILKRINELSTIPSIEELEKIAVLRSAERGCKYIKGVKIEFYCGDTIFNLFDRGVKNIYTTSGTQLEKKMIAIANRMDNLIKNIFFHECLEATLRQAKVEPSNERSRFGDHQSTNPRKRKVHENSNLHFSQKYSATERPTSKRRELERVDRGETTQIPTISTSFNQDLYANQPQSITMTDSFPTTQQLLLQYAKTNEKPSLMPPTVTGGAQPQLRSLPKTEAPINCSRDQQKILTPKSSMHDEAFVVSPKKSEIKPKIFSSTNTFVDKILTDGIDPAKRLLPPILREKTPTLPQKELGLI